MDLECDDVFHILHFFDKCHISLKIEERALIYEFVLFVI